jgi:hypothetical protein
MKLQDIFRAIYYYTRTERWVLFTSDYGYVVHSWGTVLFFIINTVITEMHVSCLLHFALDVPGILHIVFMYCYFCILNGTTLLLLKATLHEKNVRNYDIINFANSYRTLIVHSYWNFLNHLLLCVSSRWYFLLHFDIDVVYTSYSVGCVIHLYISTILSIRARIRFTFHATELSWNLYKIIRPILLFVLYYYNKNMERALRKLKYTMMIYDNNNIMLLHVHQLKQHLWCLALLFGCVNSFGLQVFQYMILCVCTYFLMQPI